MFQLILVYFLSIYYIFERKCEYMKITRMKLKNFISVYVTMNRKEIDIDFTKGKNNIILLVGANGSGKTSLLSNMQPFATLGTLDLRNSQDLILDGEDGYKLIEYDLNDHHYKIEHHYLWNNGRRKTLSYIKLDGKELNPSGLVGSFNDIIKMHFQLDPSFLKMIRLGPNVTDIIKMKTSERKDYIGALLAEVDIYNKYFKVANDESKYLKNVIKMVSSKIDKIEDISQLEESKKALEESIKETKERKAQLEKELYTFTGEYQSKILDEQTKSNYLSAYNVTNKLRKEYYDYINRYNIKSYDEFVNKLNRIKELFDKSKRDFDVNGILLAKMKDQYNTDLENKSKLENKIKILTSDQSLEKLMITKSNIIEQLSKIKYDNSIKGKTEHYKDLSNAYQNIFKLISDIYEFPIQSLEIIKEESQGINGINNIISEVNKICTSKMKKLSEKIAISKMGKAEVNKGVILYIPSECKAFHKCPYYISLKNTKADTKKSLTTLNNEFDHYVAVKDIFAKFTAIQSHLSNIRDNEYIEDIFKKDDLEVLIQILNHNINYWKELSKNIDNYLSISQDNEEYEKLENTLKQVESDIDNLQNNTEYKMCVESLNNYNQIIEKSKKEITDLNTQQQILDNTLEQFAYDYKVIQDIYDNYITYKGYTEIEENYQKLLENDKIENELKNKSITYKSMISQCEDQIKAMENKLFNEVLYKINEKKSALEEKEVLEDKFEYVEIIKESLSSTKGIPLIFIQLYLKNIQSIANNIIHHMFGENLTLLDFVISEKEFSIPYMVNGIQVKDVSLASQGERSAIVMGLSFAMLQQYMAIYNVMLFDELDGPLDVRNKRKFIEVVEKQMKSINAEQVIMITHNNIFEDYPVDLILTSDNNESNFNNSNIIWSV